MPMCQVTTHAQGPVLCQKPCQVQSNLTCPCPHLALALKDTAGRLGDTGLQQQSNLHLPVGRSQGRIREPFVQQSNLCFRGTASPHLQNSCLPPTGPSSHQKQTFQVTGCLDLRLSADLAPLDGCTWPGPRPWCRSGSWAPRLVGEPLTLEDLSVSDHSQSQASSPFSCSTAHWLLDSTQHLQPESQTSWEHPGLTQRGPHNCGGQSTPAQSWPSHSKESLSFLETLENEAQNIVTLDSQAACQKLLSESFRVWRRLSQRHQAVAKATAMRHRQLIRKSLRELRWVLWLQETRLEAAWEQQAKALLAWSFREWRHVALQQKLEQPHTQAAPTFLASRGSLSLERKAATDLAWRCRCFKAWQRLAKRGAQYRRHLAHRRVRTLRVCLGQWIEMKQLQASDVTKMTQLALHRQKAGNEVLSGLAPGTAMAHCLETVTHAQQLSKGPDQCSLWEICQKLALYQTLLLWRTRFYQRQQAGSFFQGMQKQILQHLLSQWHLWSRPSLNSSPLESHSPVSMAPKSHVLSCLSSSAGAAGLHGPGESCLLGLELELWGCDEFVEAAAGKVVDRQQFLCEQYQRWGQVHLQVLQKVALCWILWMYQPCLGQIHQAHAAQQLTTR
ncbi:uncharacterized protein C1orf167 homolog [Mus caroli]|uniref:Uncharacterized protein C1orf167 homolog n=1 Tax=Mus caroli TaxID=10089 RepID=A0A6P5PMQ2_MUSCR|nr:uncharacterized protein C1orf167 homolog [Mus caroli]